MSYPIPILLYHRIEESSADTATPPDVFRKHLELLKESRWKALSLDEFGFYVKTGKPVPFRSFLITFDDGHETVRTAAFDILKELGFCAVNFVCTEHLRGTPDLRGPMPGTDDERPFLSWDQVREMQASGIVDCQSHTHSHRRFDDCSLADIRRDLQTSVELLEKGLRLPRSHFTHLAWPWGKSTREWRAAATDVGFTYQYRVARLSCTLDSRIDEIPRIVFDANTLEQFQRQLWLHTGYLSPVWNFAYPIGRKLRRLMSAAA